MVNGNFSSFFEKQCAVFRIKHGIIRMYCNERRIIRGIYASLIVEIWLNFS